MGGPGLRCYGRDNWSRNPVPAPDGSAVITSEVCGGAQDFLQERLGLVLQVLCVLKFKTISKFNLLGLGVAFLLSKGLLLTRSEVG